jgi:SAM-dependent methyltransferase
VDPRERFSPAADDYARYRPDYPDDLVRACADYARLAPGAPVVDIGCGTGISSRRFAHHGYRVTGVDPNAAMLAKAREAGGAEYHEGEAARTGLADRSADLITCAQALHWFRLEDCRDEWRRILVPGGACAAFWNFRRSDGWQAEYEALLLRFSSQHEDVRRASEGGGERGAFVKASAECRDVVERELGNEQRMDWPALLGRARSSSYVVHGVADRPGFERALRALFDTHEEDGQVTFRYRTYLILWRWAP